MKSEKVDAVKRYFMYFVLYAIIGWLYEVILEFIYQNGFVNRGFLFGPYCPVYGFGAVIFILCLNKLKSKKIKIWKVNITPIFVFLGIMAISTFIELITSYVLDFTIGKQLWEYSHYRFNFQGRVALWPSFRFGVGGMAFIYILQPLFEKIFTNMKTKKLNIVFLITLLIIVVDLIYTIGFRNI